ncbi:MAG: sugar transporter permease [Clostridia bacterium]|jgi:multiple sugar transport system permease protein|nr:sugar transporter permease [Clostridia bacterium]
MAESNYKKIGLILVFTLPFLLPLVIFWVIPLFAAGYISLTDWDMIRPDYNRVGFSNYIALFNDVDFYKALWHTIVFSVGVIVPTIILGLGASLLLQKPFRGAAVYKVIIFSPWITPMVAVSIVWSWIFEPDTGFANYLLGFLGHPGLEWLKSSKTALLAVIIVTIWKGIGWTMIFYLGALEKVPDTVYEAANVDGANYLTTLTHITIPLISPTTLFLIVINLINTIQAFDQIKVLTEGGPAGSTRTLLYMYYQKAFENFEVGMASALSMIILLIILVLSLVNNYFSKKWIYY